MNQNKNNSEKCEIKIKKEQRKIQMIQNKGGIATEIVC